MKNLIPLIFFWMIIPGCSSEEQPNGSAPQTPVQTESLESKAATLDPPNLKDLKLELIAQSEPNKYALDLKWSEKNYQIAFRSNDELTYTVLDKGMTSIRIPVDGGRDITLEIEARSDDGSSIGTPVQFRVQIPRDFVFSDVTVLNADRIIECGRLFLNGSFLVGSYNLSIRCNEIISNSGTIETYPEGQVVSGEGVSGRGGGNISIESIRARGELIVNLRGEVGSAGKDGPHGYDGYMFAIHNGCKPQNGGNGGGTGQFYMTIKEESDFTLSGMIQPGTPGAAGKMSVWKWDSIPGLQCPAECRQPIVYAQTGALGTVGKKCLQNGTAKEVECR